MGWVTMILSCMCASHTSQYHQQEETRARLARTVAAAERSGKSLAEMKWAVWCVASRRVVRVRGRGIAIGLTG